MNCIYYQNDSLNTLSEKERDEHLKICPLCLERAEFENEIMQEAGQLQPLKPDLDLWGKIESTLIGESEKEKKNIYRIILGHKMWLSAAAVFIAIVTLSTFYFFSSGSDKILSRGALVKVEFTEQNYMEAIEELEDEASPKMAKMDIDLMLLYRDKLETIETQISRCREAIKNNPGNSHIRRYMLAALQDKKETLKEIINI